MLYMQRVRWTLLTVLTLLLLCTSSVHALEFDHLYIQVQENGDAEVALSYQLSVWEYLGMLSQWVKPDQYMESMLSSTLHRNVTLLCIGKEGAIFHVTRFADVEGDRYTTVGFQMAERTQYGPFSTLDMTSNVTLVFPDQRSYTYTRTTRIPSLTHTSGLGDAAAPPPPLDSCWKRDLPLSWLFPDEFAPLAAVISGIAAVAVVNSVGTTGSSLFQRIGEFLQKFLLKLFSPLLSRKEVEIRNLSPEKSGNRVLATLSRREILSILVSAIVFSLAYLLKDRLQLLGITLLVFLVMGGMATIAHELSHRFLTHHWKGDSEFQLWEIGTLMMLATAWLFGTVFAKPSRTLIASTDLLTSRQSVLITLAGPAANLVFALGSLLLLPLGGVLILFGQAGFSMNLLCCVYDLIPVAPMDGKKLFHYHKAVWVAVFVPLLLLYLFVYLLS